MYKMYLFQETETGSLALNFPILPDELKIKCAMDNETYKVLALGEINVPGNRGLRSFSIESFFPAEEAEVSLRIIERMIANQLPIRFILARRLGNLLDRDINLPVLIEEFETSEAGGEVGDIYFTLKLKEWRAYKAKVIRGA